MADPARSPYELVLGDAIDGLPDALRRYFGAIPAGRVGRGSGVFTTVGTPRRWLWPFLALLGRGGAMFPVWEHDVPFEVENRPVTGDGRPAVAARRTFRFRSGAREMTDLIGVTPGGTLLYDLLGRDRTILVVLTPSIDDGRLLLRSREVRLRFGPLRLRVPDPLSPRATLEERHDGSEQHVTLTIDLPLVGRVYEYAGGFTYAIEEDAG